MTDETRCEPPPEWQLMAYECVPPEVVADDLLGVLTDLAHNPTADKTIINTLRRARANVQTFTPPAVVAALEAERDDWKRLCAIAESDVAALRQEVQRAGKACFDAQQETVFYRAEVARMKKAASTINEEVCQTLGAALGYPWFKDDQTNFPGATEADGVCVGPHVAESLAAEAAAKLATVAALVEALEAADQFIRNGIELGFIRMPSPSTPDPAHGTPDKVAAALALCIAALRARAGGEG